MNWTLKKLNISSPYDEIISYDPSLTYSGVGDILNDSLYVYLIDTTGFTVYVLDKITGATVCQYAHSFGAFDSVWDLKAPSYATVINKAPPVSGPPSVFGNVIW